ncbi:MAG: gamma-glutamylcyclotransferase [Chloroflexi bacterium]|nr:gamma-glutamylcyclotransferase [Chloroflexota bacterium]
MNNSVEIQLVMPLYFAYASNMDPVQMRRRCPGATFLRPACAHGYTLAFTRYSTPRKGGSADMVESPDDAVWGALYEVDEEGLRALDRWEEVPYAYRRAEVEVVAEDGVRYQAVTYFAHRTGRFLPSRIYLERILRGALARGLPSDYIARLEAIPRRR